MRAENNANVAHSHDGALVLIRQIQVTLGDGQNEADGGRLEQHSRQDHSRNENEEIIEESEF